MAQLLIPSKPLSVYDQFGDRVKALLYRNLTASQIRIVDFQFCEIVHHHFDPTEYSVSKDLFSQQGQVVRL